MWEEYYSKMETLICDYERVYRGRRHRYAALKLAVWNLLYLFSPQRRTPCYGLLKIAFVSSGGLGDHLLFANYVYHFWKKFSGDAIQMDIFFKDKFHLASHLFRQGSEWCSQYYEWKELKKENYDLVLDLAGFPKIERIDKSRIRKLSPAILEYTEFCEKYKVYCRSAFRGNAYGMSKLCELEGRTIVQRGDIYHLLGITGIRYPLFIDLREEDYLRFLGLENRTFITVQTGIDSIYKSHVKQWPAEYWRDLIQRIRTKHAELVIVQVGNSGLCCVDEGRHDLNLLGKTDLEQIKVLLKNSRIHIDIEGGLVHLRNALQGGISIVLFGPTSAAFFGYADNCNIRSGVCSQSCYQMTTDWPYRCPKSKNEIGDCMQAIDAETVFGYFEEIYNG